MNLSAAEIPEVKVTPVRLDQPLSYNSILLTGATGVLGGHLLKELLKSTDARIFCLVRADDEAHARTRLLRFLSAYDPEGLLLTQFNKRVIPVLGDIVSPRFGLSTQGYNELADQVDVTIHVAALTNLFLNYRRIEPVNLGGTQRAVEFALQTRQKYLCYVSTYTVIGDKVFDASVRFKETDLDIGQGFESMTYQHTKFLAEKWVRSATESGLKWNIMRPGQIFGESDTGLYPQGQGNVSGLFYDIFKTVIETRLALHSETFFDIVPVDYVSRGIVQLALKQGSIYETYHLTNPDQRTYTEIIELLRDQGYAIEFVSQEEYRRRLFERGIVIDGVEYKSSTISAFKWWYKREKFDFAAASAMTDCEYTQNTLRQSGIECHPIDRKLISAYVKACVKEKYFPQPHRVKHPGSSLDSKSFESKNIGAEV